MPGMGDLFQADAGGPDETYSARHIEVLEGLDPVRRRPGMYIGGTDQRALHHLAAEVIDNAMDEAVAGHATRIDISLALDGTLTVRDNGRGIPVDEHPQFPGTSALEIILTRLHSGGKFSGDSYQTSGGLHGVGLCVVNALSEDLTIEVIRGRRLFVQSYARGIPKGPIDCRGTVSGKRGTSVRLRPDPAIFGEGVNFDATILYRLVVSKGYLFRGVEIAWTCAADLPRESDVPDQALIHFPGGLTDFLSCVLNDRTTITARPFAGEAPFADEAGRVEWAIAWPTDQDGFSSTFCNTIPTPQAGSHEQGLRLALTRAVRAYGDMTGNRRAAQITADDIVGDAAVVLSVFMRNPQFQGQTKEKLTSPEAQRLVETAIKDRFDHWLAAGPTMAGQLIEHLIERAEERQRRRAQKDTQRKSATRRLRLPGKLTDCSRSTPDGTEIFLVEGDSAGGSAKQARNRETQAILPLRGKILNVASASAERLRANQEIADLVLALGCGHGRNFDITRLRYERVIIMTDADVDGAHIASLLMTFFYQEMPDLIRQRHLYLAMPPLYRLQSGGLSVYARDDTDRDRLLKTTFRQKKVETSRFKGLGEMLPVQLRETTMDPVRRTLVRVTVPEPQEAEAEATRCLVERLMGRKAELRFAFIQERAPFVSHAIDV